MSRNTSRSNVDTGGARGRRAGVIALFAALLYAMVVVPAGSPRALAADAPDCPAVSGQAYTIGSGDVLQVSVWQQKALNKTLTVRPDGDISFPLIGDVRAAGLTPMQLTATMTKQLRRYLANPQVSVIVKQANSFKVSVLGEVHQPGRYRVTSDNTTVLDILAEAGGFTSYADKDSIGVLRQDGKDTKRIHFLYFKAISGHPGNSDFCVRPGDTIIVP